MVWRRGRRSMAPSKLPFMRSLSHDTEPLQEVFRDVSLPKNKKTKEERQISICCTVYVCAQLVEENSAVIISLVLVVSP